MSNKIENIRNIALFAHVDAGKTTITENFLFSNGNIRLKGNVNKGTSKTDFLDIENLLHLTNNSGIYAGGII